MTLFVCFCPPCVRSTLPSHLRYVTISMHFVTYCIVTIHHIFLFVPWQQFREPLHYANVWLPNRLRITHSYRRSCGSAVYQVGVELVTGKAATTLYQPHTAKQNTFSNLFKEANYTCTHTRKRTQTHIRLV